MSQETRRYEVKVEPILNPHSNDKRVTEWFDVEATNSQEAAEKALRIYGNWSRVVSTRELRFQPEYR